MPRVGIGIDKQVEEACQAFANTLELARPLLTNSHRIRLPGRTRPVELMEPVALEDLLDAAVRWIEELRAGYGRAIQRPAVLWIQQQVDGFPQLATHGLDAKVLTLSQPEWLRRRSACADQLVAALLGWAAEDAARTVHRRRGDYDRLMAADIRLARCRQCGTPFCWRRSEPLIDRCETCRERMTT